MAEAGWEIAGKVRMTPKGVYDSTVSYKILDLVSDEGHTQYYIAKQDVPAGTLLTNTTYWDPIMDVSDIPDQIEDIESDVTDLKSEIVTKAGMIYVDASGDLVSISDGADDGAVKALTVGIEPVQSGSGDPSPDNVRPITGRTGASVRVTGANLWGGTALASDLVAISSATPGSDDYGSYVRLAASYASKKILFSKFKPNTVYTIILTLKKSNTSGLTNLIIRYTDGTSQNIARNGREADVVETFAFTTTAGKSIDYIGGGNQSGNTYLYYDECGVFEGVLTAEDYVAYVGTTYPVSWETEAGEIYGGTLDVLTGTLTVDKVKKTVLSVNSTENRYGVVNLGAYDSVFPSARSNTYCNLLKKHTGAASQITNYSYTIYNSSARNRSIMAIRFGNTESAFEDYNATLSALNDAGTPLEVVYQLTEPLATYQLTPQEITTLLGLNNIWADCGPVNALTYPADTKLYVDGQIEAQTRATRSLIAGIETGMTASQAYSVGDLLIIGDVLYKVTSAIASGATFTPETNVTATSVAEQLLLLANS